MTVQMIRANEVTRPTPDPLRSSILDHATVAPDMEAFGLRNNHGMWPSYNCLDTLVPVAGCPSPWVDGTFKTFSFPEWVPAFEFNYYAGVQCLSVGLDTDDMRREIARVYERNEGKGIERALLASRFVATDSDAEVSWDAPVEVGDTGMSLPAAIGALEGYAAVHYAGVPTLHMPRSLVVIGFGLGLLKDEGGKFFTKTGAKVAAGGGYDSPDLPMASTQDIYATGEVYIERTTAVDVGDVRVLPGDGSGIGSDENGLRPNTVIGFAERGYRVAVDCFVAKATATLPLVTGF